MREAEYITRATVEVSIIVLVFLVIIGLTGWGLFELVFILI
jgi:hypothetical protein